MDHCAKKVTELRSLMQQEGLDYYYVPLSDQHHNEYVPPCSQRLQWLTGFGGSNGYALIGLEQAYFFTDGRYQVQVRQQVDVDLFEIAILGMDCDSVQAWMLECVQDGKVLGYDPKLLSHQMYLSVVELGSDQSIQLKPIADNLMDRIWHDQPPLPAKPIVVYPLEFAGQSSDDKIKAVRSDLSKASCSTTVLNDCAEIAWLLNLRGNDIDFSPIFMGYLILTADDVRLFVNPSQLSHEGQHYLEQLGVVVVDYDGYWEALTHLSGTVWVDPEMLSALEVMQLGDLTLYQSPSPIQWMKACKNRVELAGMVQAHLEDANALISFMCWLDECWDQGLTEYQMAARLDQFRLNRPACLDLSFDTISGFADNGAVIHYKVEEASAKVVDRTSLYLVDSGGQYWGGTTDVTRVMHGGEPTPQQKLHYTLVLKGNLALERAVFPKGTCGEHLDSLARQYLWEHGLNYYHGTGHGVGSYLSVHEGPQSISPRHTGVPLCEGMVISNEPGYYLEGSYGIRIENLLQVVKAHDVGEKYLKFECLTQVPYARHLIDLALLTRQEIKQIDTYHAKLYQTLQARLMLKEGAWLLEQTKSLLGDG